MPKHASITMNGKKVALVGRTTPAVMAPEAREEGHTAKGRDAIVRK